MKASAGGMFASVSVALSAAMALEALRAVNQAESLGALAYAYPQQLTIEASDDGTNWRAVQESPLAALAIRAALRNQLDARIEIELPDVEARWLRLKRVASEKAPVWVLAELTLKAR